MKKNSLIIHILIFVFVIAAAGIIYTKLSESYSPEESKSGSLGESSTVEQAPDFTVLDTGGNEVSLSDFIGKPVVVNFWATWCSPCKSELPAFETAAEKYGEDVVFLMVNLTDGARDTVEKVTKFVEDNEYSFPLYFDTEYSAAIAYSVYSIPMTVLINADGSLLDSHIGAMSEETLNCYIEDLTGGMNE